ncbi:hypothetical protein ACFYO9_12095 [Streptomyces sp. NPDC005863]|uniref:hypothetical protein n=1 Tax=unclassified Streptomyces TaxID=2593676 RepID=UPI0033D855F8
MNRKGLRIAATVAMAGVAFGVAAPMASATEAHRAQEAAVQLDESLRPTASDVRDLISRMRTDGANEQEIQQFELYAQQLEDPHHRTKRALGMGTIVRKLIVAGLRHGGTWAGKILGKVNKKTGRYVGKYGNKIADAIEDVEGWSETALSIALVRAGVPTDVAHDLAHAIMLVAI